MLETILIFITLGFVTMSVLYFRCADRCMIEDEEYEGGIYGRKSDERATK